MGLLQVRTTTSDHSVFLLSFVVEQEQGPKNNYCRSLWLLYEKTPNLHQSHICQWGAQPYLVGPISRLVGKPHLSPWVSANVLPLTLVVNNTNSAIPLTEIFDRVFSDVCNSVGFEVQKQKKRGSGNNRVYRNLKVFSNTFLRFAVAFLEHSENLRLRRGKKNGSLIIKNTSPKLSNNSSKSQGP